MWAPHEMVSLLDVHLVLYIILIIPSSLSAFYTGCRLKPVGTV